MIEIFFKIPNPFRPFFVDCNNFLVLRSIFDLARYASLKILLPRTKKFLEFFSNFFFLLDSITDRVTLPLGEEFYDRGLRTVNRHSFLAIQNEIR